jgi:hypothetical protein
MCCGLGFFEQGFTVKIGGQGRGKYGRRFDYTGQRWSVSNKKKFSILKSGIPGRILIANRTRSLSEYFGGDRPSPRAL